MNLRTLARGRPCLVRIPGVCNGNAETTVLAHYRPLCVSGMGMKSPDALAAWACSSCHDAIDRRAHMDLDREYVRLAHLEGGDSHAGDVDRDGETQMEVKRGRREALTQRAKYELRLNREAGIPLNICAQMAGVSRATAARALAELRALLGPEKIPARKRHLVRSHCDTSQRATVSNID